MEYKEDDHEDSKLVIISKTNGQCFGFHALRNISNASNISINLESVNFNCVAVTDLIVYQLSHENLQRYMVYTT